MSFNAAEAGQAVLARREATLTTAGQNEHNWGDFAKGSSLADDPKGTEEQSTRESDRPTR